MEIVEHDFEQPRIALQRGLVDRVRRLTGGGGLEQVERRQLEIVVAQVERCLLGLGLGRRGRELAVGDHRAGRGRRARRPRAGAGAALRCGSAMLGSSASPSMNAAAEPARNCGRRGSRRSDRSSFTPRAHTTIPAIPSDQPDAAPGPQIDGRIADEADRPAAARRRCPARAMPPQPAGSASTDESDDERAALRRSARRRARARSIRPQRPTGASRHSRCATISASGSSSDDRRAEQREQQVGEPRAGRPEQVARRPARGGVQRRIAGMIAGERQDHDAACRGTARSRRAARCAARARLHRVAPQRRCARLAMIVPASAVSSHGNHRALAESRVKVAALCSPCVAERPLRMALRSC